MDLHFTRVTKRVTQWELAKKTGISQTQISLFERGYKDPSLDEQKKLAKALGVRVRDIFPNNAVVG